MFEDTKESISNLKRSLATTEDVVLAASRDSKELQRQITNAKSRLSRKQSGARGEAIANRITKSLLKEKKTEEILIESIDVATRKSTEFNTDFYRYMLHYVAQQKEIYKLNLYGAGWNMHLVPTIAFELVAGTLNDYARGIRAYRASLKTVIGATDVSGMKATEYWFSKVYSTDKEEYTVAGRVGASGRAAPFFQLLDSGSQPLASDRPDQSYNPLHQSPTGFIRDAEDKIQKEFNSRFIKETSKELETAELLEKEITKAVEYKDELVNLIGSLSTDERRNKTAYGKLSKIAKYINDGKLNLSIDKYAKND